MYHTQENYTIESHAHPPSPANHSRQPWKTLRRPQPAASRPQLIIQVPSGPRCDWPHRPTKRTGYAPAVSCWARVFQRTLVPGGPFHPPGSRRLPCSKTGLSLSFTIFTTTAVLAHSRTPPTLYTGAVWPPLCPVLLLGRTRAIITIYFWATGPEGAPRGRAKCPSSPPASRPRLGRRSCGLRLLLTRRA